MSVRRDCLGCGLSSLWLLLMNLSTDKIRKPVTERFLPPYYVAKKGLQCQSLRSGAQTDPLECEKKILRALGNLSSLPGHIKYSSQRRFSGDTIKQRLFPLCIICQTQNQPRKGICIFRPGRKWCKLMKLEVSTKVKFYCCNCHKTSMVPCMFHVNKAQQSQL